MANDQAPIIRVIGFKTTYARLPVRGTDPLNETVDERGFLLDKLGRRVMDMVAEDWATYAPSHAPLSVQNCERVRHLIPDAERLGDDVDGVKLAFMMARWSQIEPAYDAWKAGHALPTNGTPLSVWPGLNPEQVEILRQSGLRSIEDVRDLSEVQIDRVRLPNMRDIRLQAKLFLENTGSAVAAAREAEKDAQMEAMREQMEEMRLQLANLATAEPSETAPDDDAPDAEVAKLRSDLAAKGIPFDRRWAAPKLRTALAGAVSEAA